MHREKGNTGLTCLQRGKERKWLLNKKYCKTYLIGGGGKERQLLEYIVHSKEEKGGGKAHMRRIVLDMKGGLLAEAVMQSLAGYDPDFLVYRSSKPEETLALCRTCRANVLVMEVIRQGTWKLSERLRLCSAVKQLGWVCKTLLLVDENADELLASEVRQAVKDQLVDNFIYASVSPTYLAGVIDTL